MIALEQCEIASGFGQFGEPTLTFDKSHLWVNAACLKAMPDALYILFLIDRAQRVLILKPGDEEEQRTIRWKTPKGSPRKLTCDDFLRDIAVLAQWDQDRRRKIPGRIARDESGTMLVFDLKERRQTETLEEYRQHPLVKRLEEDIQNAD